MNPQQPSDPKVKVLVPNGLQTGVYANAFTITVGQREITIDFGYILPNTVPPTVEVVSRVNMHPEAAKAFLSSFQNTLLDFENARKKSEPLA